MSLVTNAFTETAVFSSHTAYSLFYFQLILSDILIELEIDSIDRILTKINPYYDKNKPFSNEVMSLQTDEFKLWYEIRSNGLKGRRVGNGYTALGDMFAALNIQYGSIESQNLLEELMITKNKAELDASVDLAVLLGTFEGYDDSLEYDNNGNGKNKFFDYIKRIAPEQVERMRMFGRRNVSYSTLAPTGTTSIMTQTTSGLEPLFSPYYIRRVKVDNVDNSNYTDVDGEHFKTYVVVHPKLKEYTKIVHGTDLSKEYDEEFWKNIYEVSPYYKSCAEDISYKSRLAIQSIIQKGTSHSISSTLNLPNDITVQEVKDLYMYAYDMDLKGITIYRDGSRGGVLVKSDAPKEVLPTVIAPKRPKVLEADVYTTKNKGVQYLVVIGLFGGKPYEVFVLDIPSSYKIEAKKGTITKEGKGHYSFNCAGYACDNLSKLYEDNLEKKSTALYTSMLLRTGADIKFVIKTAKKVDDNISSFTSAMCRILSKYIPKEDTGETCPECGGKLIREGGCIKCQDCPHSKCLMLISKK